jgi:hypothetical protein
MGCARTPLFFKAYAQRLGLRNIVITKQVKLMLSNCRQDFKTPTYDPFVYGLKESGATA